MTTLRLMIERERHYSDAIEKDKGRFPIGVKIVLSTAEDRGGGGNSSEEWGGGKQEQEWDLFSMSRRVSHL